MVKVIDWNPLDNTVLSESEILDRAKGLTTWPVPMYLPIPGGEKAVFTGGGVHMLARGDHNVTTVDMPTNLGGKAFWFIDALELMLGTLENKLILDVGCCTGYISLQAALRGARIVASEMHHDNMKRSELVYRTWGVADRVMIVESDMESMSVDTMGKFDAVILAGTIYHCENPYDVLANISKMTDHILVESPIAKSDEVNDNVRGYNFNTKLTPDEPTHSSIRKVGGGILRKATRESLWRMIRDVGFNFTFQLMPFQGISEQYQKEDYVTFVGYKTKD